MAVSTSSSSAPDRNLFPILSISFIFVLLLLSAISALTSFILSPAPNPSPSSSGANPATFPPLLTLSPTPLATVLRSSAYSSPSTTPEIATSSISFLTLPTPSVRSSHSKSAQPSLIVVIVIIPSLSSSSSLSSPHLCRRRHYPLIVVFVAIVPSSSIAITIKSSHLLNLHCI